MWTLEYGVSWFRWHAFPDGAQTSMWPKEETEEEEEEEDGGFR